MFCFPTKARKRKSESENGAKIYWYLQELENSLQIIHLILEVWK